MKAKRTWRVRICLAGGWEWCELEQAQVVWVFALQRANQDFKIGEAAEILEAGVFQEEGPTGESGANTAFEPFEGGFAAAQNGEDAGGLIIGIVRMSEGLWNGTDLG